MIKLLLISLTMCMNLVVYAAGTAGLNYTTYLPNGSWSSPNQNTLIPLTSGNVSDINFNWNYVLDSGRADGVVVKFTGYFKAESTGTYQFGLTGDDGVQLIINDQYVINYWNDQGPTFRSGSIYLTAGSIVPITIWFYENGGGATLQWYWWNNNSWQIVPNSLLATDNTFWGSTIIGGSMSQTNAPNNQIITSGSSSSAGITQSQQTKVNLWVNKSINDNSIYIDQIGNDNTVTINQIGDKNIIAGIYQSAVLINGNQNSLIINQGTQSLGKNEINLLIEGSLNSVNIGQSRDNLGTAIGVNGHFNLLEILGSLNNITIQQSNVGGIGGHYMESIVIGDSNLMINKQLDNSNKIMFSAITGSHNNATAIQQGTGQHYLEYKLLGNGHSANINQIGSSQNKASIELTNAGGPATLNLTQTGGQSFSIIQSCNIPAGCITTVNQ